MPGTDPRAASAAACEHCHCTVHRATLPKGPGGSPQKEAPLHCCRHSCTCLSHTLHNATQERKREEEEDIEELRHRQLPVFLLPSVRMFPGMPLTLNVFEPRSGLQHHMYTHSDLLPANLTDTTPRQQLRLHGANHLGR